MSDLKAIVEALIFASPEPVTLKTLVKLLDTEPKEDIVAAIEALQAGLRRGPAGCRWSRSPAATRSSRGPSCTSGCGGCSTSARRRSCRCVARDARGHRLQAAGHRAGDRRDSRREHGRRRSARSSSASWSRSSAASRSSAGRSCTARRASSSSASASTTCPTCRRSRTCPSCSASTCPPTVGEPAPQTALPFDDERDDRDAEARRVGVTDAVRLQQAAVAGRRRVAPRRR